MTASIILEWRGVETERSQGQAWVAHNCNLNTLGGRGRQITWGQEFETSLANMMKPHLYLKYKT